MNFTIVTTLLVESNSNSSCRVKAECSNNCISVVILDGNTAYAGEISPEYISNQCKIFDLSEKEYVDECRKAFQNSVPNQFTYTITDDYFHIKKTVATNSENSIKVKFTGVKLDKVDFQESVLGMLDTALSENNQFVKNVEELQSANKALKEGNELLLEQLKNLQTSKNELEKYLYLRFLNLLNSKKKTIKELKRSSGVTVEDTTSESDEEMPLEDSANVYDADTDVDDEIAPVTNEFKPEECSSKGETSSEKPVDQVEKTRSTKAFQKSSDVFNEEARSKGTSIFDQLDILDPTIPFVG